MLLTYRSQMDPALLGFGLRWPEEGQTRTCKIRGIQIVEDRVVIVLQGITELVKLPEIRCENDDVLTFVPLLGKVAYDLEYHLYFVRV